jgi:hypothetical protein
MRIVFRVIRVLNVATPQNFIALKNIQDGQMVGPNVAPMKANAIAVTTWEDEQQ